MLVSKYVPTTVSISRYLCCGTGCNAVLPTKERVEAVDTTSASDTIEPMMKYQRQCRSRYKADRDSLMSVLDRFVLARSLLRSGCGVVRTSLLDTKVSMVNVIDSLYHHASISLRGPVQEALSFVSHISDMRPRQIIRQL